MSTNNPVKTVSYFFKGLGMLGNKQLRPYIIFPLLVNLILYAIVFELAYYYVDDLISQLIPAWLHWLNWIIWPLFFISFILISYFTFTVLANIISAPFYDKLSAKTLCVITGQDLSITESSWLKVMKAELKRVAYIGSRSLLLLIVSIIPGVNLIAPVLWAVFGAWSMAMEYVAYPMENEGILFDDQKKLLKKHPIGTLSYGGITMLGLTIPLLNIFVAPASVIGATIYFHEMRQASASHL
jgi:CysZ protein